MREKNVSHWKLGNLPNLDRLKRMSRGNGAASCDAACDEGTIQPGMVSKRELGVQRVQRVQRVQ